MPNKEFNITECLSVRLGARRWIVTWPNCWAYGDFLLGICFPLVIAAHEAARLVLIREGPFRRDAAFDIAARGVHCRTIGRPLSWFALALLRARARAVRLLTSIRCLASALAVGTHESRHWLRDRFARRHPAVDSRKPVAWRAARSRDRKAWRAARKAARRTIDRLPRSRQLFHGRDQSLYGYDLRRMIADNGTGASLGRQREALRLAARYGLDADTPIVTVHVREAGWHGKYTPYSQQRKDDKRNARIADFASAFDRLARSGYTIVRIGDRTMTPVDHTAAVDLAHAGLQDNLLQLWAVQQSRFMIACDSGPLVMAWLLDTPMLMVNAVCHLECYPLRRSDRMMVKRVERPDDGRCYRIRDMWTYEFLSHYKTLSPRYYRDNTPEELAAAVEEMLEVTGNSPPDPSPAQREIRRLADALNRSEPLTEKRRRAPGVPYVTTGEGYVSRCLADR